MCDDYEGGADENEKSKRSSAEDAKTAKAVLDHCLFHERFNEEFRKWLKTWGILGFVSAVLALVWGITKFEGISHAFSAKEERLDSLSREVSTVAARISAAKGDADTATASTKIAESLTAMVNSQLMESRSLVSQAQSLLSNVEVKTANLHTEIDELKRLVAESRMDIGKQEQQIGEARTQAERASTNASSASALASNTVEKTKQLIDVNALVSEVVILHAKAPVVVRMPDMEYPFESTYDIKLWTGSPDKTCTVNILVEKDGKPMNYEPESRAYNLSFSESPIGSKGQVEGPRFNTADYLRKDIWITNTPFAVSPMYFFDITRHDAVMLKLSYLRSKTFLENMEKEKARKMGRAGAQ